MDDLLVESLVDIASVEENNGLYEGEVFMIVSQFTYEGEPYFVLLNDCSNLVVWPSKCFCEFTPSADPARAGFYGESDWIERAEKFKSEK